MLRKKDKMNESSKQTWTLKTTKLIIARNKYQCQQNKMNDYWTKDQCWQHPNEWFLKSNANAMNMQMNYC